MNWSSSISHPGYRPDLYDHDCTFFSSVTGDNILQYEHTHQSNEKIRSLVLEILQSKNPEEAKTIINKILRNVRRCNEYIHGRIPKEETPANSRLRKEIAEQHHDDEAIITFLDTALITLAVQQGKADQEKAAKEKGKNGCIIM